MQANYRGIRCVGGYVDKDAARMGNGARTILAGEDPAWGDTKLAVIQTSDSRSSKFGKLGQHSTWIKWATPSAEALRQACLADESRISLSEPELPAVVITELRVSNSKFMGPVELAMNPQYNDRRDRGRCRCPEGGPGRGVGPQAPDNVGDIEGGEYASARTFLANFDGKIYTVNYDLLLYWILLQDAGPSVWKDDGFRADPDDADAEWVIWDGYEGFSQRVFYLHGGLHLYDAGSQLKKITWVRTGIPLIDQIREALAENVYPHVVTEGSSEQKLGRIEHSPYLHRGLKSLNSCGGSLLVFGHSLAETTSTSSLESRTPKSNLYSSVSTAIRSRPKIARSATALS